ncbi:MAG: CDP-alcohol phosphatidyltransferase family protein, partial [Bacteroidetes bacterium]|nr:CDP-alcohol phosphatidyltransferase family protein [Bacteroidota bacterium]
MNYSYHASIKSNRSDELVNVYLQRPAAGIITMLLFYLPVTPNFVTLLSTLAGIAASLLLFFPSPDLILSALLFYAKDIFDSADGQLARAKQLYSRRGRFYDSIGDFVVHLFLFVGIYFQLRYAGYSYGSAALVSVIGFLGVNLRVSYQVYYQTAFLHEQKKYLNNRLSEELQPEDFHEDRITLLLQKIFLGMYGWQDAVIKRIDTALTKNISSESELHSWNQNSAALFLNRLYGLGTEFVLLTLSLLFLTIEWYLIISIFFMNLLWIISLLYRIFLSKRIEQ